MIARRTLAVLATAGAMFAVILAPGASRAGTTGTIADDPQLVPQPYDAPLGGRHPNNAQVNGCDFLNAPLSVNKALLAYNNENPTVGGAPNPRGCLGEADIMSYSMTSLIGNKLELKFTVRGTFPKAGGVVSPLAALSGGEFHYYIFFQNKRRQNARQIIGDAPNCQQYAHAGPHLSENNEYFFLGYDIAATDNTTAELKYGKPQFGWGRWDPVGNILYGTRTYADPAIPASAPVKPLSQFCSGGTHTPLSSWSGTGMTATASGNTLTMTVPMNYCWNNLSNIINCYELAAVGDTITGVQAAVHASVFVGTPDLTGSGGPGPTGAGQNLLVDWAPYAAYDFGTLTPQTERIPGPTCPHFNAAQYFTSGELPANPTYVTTGKGTSGTRDNDYQTNPLYGSRSLRHYDASAAAGTSNADPLPTGTQDHFGPTGCDIFIPTASGFKAGFGGSFTA